MTSPTIGEQYTHYKRGGTYEIIHIGYLQSNTVDDGQTVVIYTQLHDAPNYPSGTVWVRTIEMFCEEVPTLEGPSQRRFLKLNS
jgi:hypothetical protein